MPTRWYQGTVINIESLSTTTRQFTLSVDGDTIFDFKPGQFVTMDLPVSEKRLYRWRSYSIANTPNNNNILQFCIVRSSEGLGTKYFFEDVTIGSVLKFKGPDGGFTLPDDLSREIIMICTCTGVAPFRSMIRQVIDKKMTFKKYTLSSALDIRTAYYIWTSFQKSLLLTRISGILWRYPENIQPHFIMGMFMIYIWMSIKMYTKPDSFISAGGRI
ncbi:MAG: hypothetical protein IPN89_02255 [Saprospiraceae bacterium]|nr:hypothetical protein [Saprospiraceae bacterium]